MLAKQQTETTKIYSIPRRLLKEPGKDLFTASHTNYFITADKCSDCKLGVRWNTRKQRSISGRHLVWLEVTLHDLPKKRNPVLQAWPNSKAEPLVLFVSFVLKEAKTGHGESFSRGEILLLKGSMTLQSKHQCPNTCTAWRNQREWKKVKDGKEESQNPELTSLTS